MAAERTFQRLVAQLDYPMFIATVAAGSELSELFGGETGDELDRFERCAWRPGPGDVPLIDDCPNRFVGRIGERVGFSGPGPRAFPRGGGRGERPARVSSGSRTGSRRSATRSSGGSRRRAAPRRP